MIKLKKVMWISFTILCLLSILSLKGFKISVSASTDVIHVPTEYATIQEAINHANSGDTIFVHKGTYYEHVVVNKSVSLVGEDKDLTIVDGYENDSVILITDNNVTVEGFTIKESGNSPYDSGIRVEHSSGNIIKNNKIIDNFDGISFYYSVNNLVSGNIILNNSDGIFTYSSSNNMVLKNTMSSNSYDAIVLYYSVNNVVSGNIILNNYDGISFYYSVNNMVLENNFSNNYDGLGLYFSGNNLVSGNTISNNYDGIILYHRSSNNTIFHNNFNNTNQVRTDSTNVWNYGEEGNYWSDYKGQDLNKDGIGDDPYVIDMNNQDTHPLMGMFFEFDVAFKREVYHFAIISNSTISDFKFEIGTETGNKIMHFNAIGGNGTIGFCRIKIPADFMNYPYIVLVGFEEVVPTLLDISNKTYTCLYFAYSYENQTIIIISSEMLRLYDELLYNYLKLQTNIYNLNITYNNLMNNYTILLADYGQLKKSFDELNASYQILYRLNATYYSLVGDYSKLQITLYSLNVTYYDLVKNYLKLQMNIYGLNMTYYNLLGNYTALLTDYIQLQEDYNELDTSYQKHLLNYTENVHNIQNLIYIFVATTAIFIITIIYLSKRAHIVLTTKTEVFKDKE